MDLLLSQFHCNGKCDGASHQKTQQKHLFVITLFVLFVL